MVILAESGQSRRATSGPAESPGAISGGWFAGGGSGPIIAGNPASVDALSGFAPTAQIAPAKVQDPTTAGGGGGATSRAPGGAGGGEKPGTRNQPPQRGALGSGGGGGEGSRFECDAGAPGGHGFVAVRPG